MQTLRFIAASLASVLCALGLSVGAAMAEDPHDGGQAREAHDTLAGNRRLVKDVKKKQRTRVET